MKAHFALSLLFAAGVISSAAATILGDPSSGNECKANRGECVDWYKEAPKGAVISGNLFTDGCMDIVVFLDIKEDISEFNEAKDYIKKLIRSFKFGPSGSRIAVITCSNEEPGTVTVISFDDSVTQTTETMLASIDAITPTGGDKKTLAGLTAMKETFNNFTRGLGDKNRVGILLTDGKKEPPSKTAEIDVCIILDLTGSMGGSLSNVRTGILQWLEDLEKEFPEGLSMRVAISTYRDTTEAKNLLSIDFESDIEKVENFLYGLVAKGGGDYPEDFLGGASEATKFNWSKTATKILVAITDAPGHGDISVDSKDRKNIMDVFFTLKCEIGVDAGLFLITPWPLGGFGPGMDDYAQALKGITQQKCGTTSFLPGKEEWLKVDKIAPDFIMDAIKLETTTLAKEVSYTKISKELCDMKVDLLCVGIIEDIDYAPMEVILTESIRKRLTGGSEPKVKRESGQSVDSMVDSTKDLIKEGSDVCACGKCGGSERCVIVEPGVFQCNCKPGFTGPECEVGECPKCRAEAFVQSLSDETCFIPDCDEDGSFLCTQYHEYKNETFCVNSEGKEIPDTRVPGKKEIDCSEHCKTEELVGPCKAKLTRAEAKGDEFKPNCDEKGNFVAYQCFEGTCWCTQANGQLLPSTFHPEIEGKKEEYCKDQLAVKPDCSKALHHGFLNHPFDCHRYFRCSPGRLFTCSCPDGQNFDLTTCRCDWIKNVDCVKPDPEP